MKKVFRVKGMHCKSCEMLITDSIEQTPGLKVLKASFSEGVVEVDATEPALLPKASKAIEAEGYKVEN